MLRSYVRPYERSISANHHHHKAALAGGLRLDRIFEDEIGVLAHAVA